MSTECYAMVRGSAIRVTGLGDHGEVLPATPYAVSKSVAKVTVNEIVEQAGNEVLATPEEVRRIRLHRNAQTIRHGVDIEFLRVDPGVLSLVAGVRLVYAASGDPLGFGAAPFGVAPLGSPEGGEVVGFDSGTRLPAVGFALEVWSQLDSDSAQPPLLGFGETPFDTFPFDSVPAAGGCPPLLGFGETPFGTSPLGATPSAGDGSSGRRWGYTLFPHLRGGRVSGFKFHNGLISFNLVGAKTRRSSRWGSGPYDLEGPFQRLVQPVSRNTSFRTQITTGAPPAQTNGTQRLYDVLDNGTASNPMPDPSATLTVDGGGAHTEAWIIDGGRAV